MSVLTKLNDDLMTAMKEHDADRVSLLRMLKSAIKNQEIAGGKELTDPEVFSVLEKQAKQRRDAADQYITGGRPELAEKETTEAEAIAKYLPAKLSEPEIEALVSEKISELGATGIADMGRVIGAVVAAAAGTADGALVAKITKQKLA